MKKIIILVLASFLIFPLYAQSPEGKLVTAVIRELIGTVEVKVPGTSAWQPASLNMILTQDTIISTGLKSSAVIALGDSSLNVRSLTRLSLEELLESRGNEQIKLRLQTGRIRVEVHPPSGGKTNFAVRSPQATASVRGTVFEFDTVNVGVSEGKVSFAGSDGFAVTVGSGESSSIDWASGQTISPLEYTLAAIGPSRPAGTDNAAKSSGAFSLSADRSSSNTLKIVFNNSIFQDAYDPPKVNPEFSSLEITVSGSGGFSNTTRFDIEGGLKDTYEVSVPGERSVSAVSVKAVVRHPATGDRFPFAKSFGGSASIKSGAKTVGIKLSLQETGIVFPTDDKFNSGINARSILGFFTSGDGFFKIGSAMNLGSRRIAADTSLYVKYDLIGGHLISYFDFDSYGRLFAINKDQKLERFGEGVSLVLPSTSNSSTLGGIAYNRKNGVVYTAIKNSAGVYIDRINVSGSNPVLESPIGPLSGFTETTKYTALAVDTNSNNNTYIYIGGKTGAQYQIIKIDPAGSVRESFYESSSYIKDIKIIGDTLYTVTGSGASCDLAAISLADKKVIAQQSGGGDEAYDFQRIVGWDDNFLYVAAGGRLLGGIYKSRIIPVNRRTLKPGNPGLLDNEVFWLADN